MIHNYTIPIHVPPQALQAQVAARTQANSGTMAASNQSGVPSASEEFPQPGAPSAQAGPALTQNLTAALSPIDDQAQAAAATQHAGLLMQAQPRLALAAQANSSSQSVARLLQ